MGVVLCIGGTVAFFSRPPAMPIPPELAFLNGLRPRHGLGGMQVSDGKGVWREYWDEWHFETGLTERETAALLQRNLKKRDGWHPWLVNKEFLKRWKGKRVKVAWSGSSIVYRVGDESISGPRAWLLSAQEKLGVGRGTVPVVATPVLPPPPPPPAAVP